MSLVPSYRFIWVLVFPVLLAAERFFDEDLFSFSFRWLWETAGEGGFTKRIRGPRPPFSVVRLGGLEKKRERGELGGGKERGTDVLGVDENTIGTCESRRDCLWHN